MIFRALWLVTFALGAVACGEDLTPNDLCGGFYGSDRTVAVIKSNDMEESEFLQGASIGGVSSDNRRSVTFNTDMPLCVCSRVDVKVSGSSVLADPNADVTLTVGLVSNAEVTPITLENGASGEATWNQDVPLKTKGHGGLSYSFSLLITYNFPSVGSKQVDAAELRRILRTLSGTARYMTFVSGPCLNVNL